VGASPEKEDEPLDWTDHSWGPLLGREPQQPIDLKRGDFGGLLAGKTVLVTGAAGWIGSRLARRLKQSAARRVVLLDCADEPLRQIQNTLCTDEGAVECTAILGSICDRSVLEKIMQRYRPEIVYHAAALKHVPLMESHPFEAVATNTLGTYAVMKAAATYGCEQVVVVSTDKAVEPASVMGASKRVAELVMLNDSSGTVRPTAVRLGNVLGSSGSVVPTFLQQIKARKEVTVSHPAVRRFFMTTSEAVESLIGTLSPDCPKGLLVAELGSSIRIVDLANYLVAREFETTNEESRSMVPVVFTALRPGDKMKESMISDGEVLAEGSYGMLRKVVTPVPPGDELERGLAVLQAAVENRCIDELLRGIRLLAPEYTPGPLVLRRIEETSQAPVSV
jgi:FlaA1/EpsC-like NDP-sugar epimerase